MKLSMAIILGLLIVVAQTYSQSSNPGNGTGEVKVNVVYKDIGVFYNPDDVSSGHYEKSATWGEINLGNFYPPPLNECYPFGNNPGVWKLHTGGWGNVFIPFYIEGSPGITFYYDLSHPPQRIQGDEGVILGNGNLTGTQIYSPINFNPHPPSGYGNFYKADFNSDGRYYMRVEFKNLYIQYGCTAGQRTFQVLLTCSYQ